MPEEKVVTEPVKEPVTEPLVTRVSQVKPEEKKTDEAFNVNDIEKIEDPKAKEYAQKAYKSFESGYTKKFQALAEERKAWEEKKVQGEVWTTEKVQALTTDPSFVKAAQSVANQPTDEYSTLTESEKKQISDAKAIAQQAVAQNAQLLKAQQDESNKAKYANYDPNAVDILTADLLKGTVQATREHLWKVQDYDSAVERAYKLGKSDKVEDNKDKLASLSPEGTVVTGDETAPSIEKGESDRNYIKRLGMAALKAFHDKGQVRK